MQVLGDSNSRLENYFPSSSTLMTIAVSAHAQRLPRVAIGCPIISLLERLCGRTRRATSGTWLFGCYELLSKVHCLRGCSTWVHDVSQRRVSRGQTKISDNLRGGRTLQPRLAPLCDAPQNLRTLISADALHPPLQIWTRLWREQCGASSSAA